MISDESYHMNHQLFIVFLELFYLLHWKPIRHLSKFN